MGEALRGLGKRVIIISGDSQIPASFRALPGVENIVPQNFLATDLSQFDTFVSLDSGSLSQISKLGDVVFPDHLRVIVIDHHVTNEGYGHINLVDSSYPATCQILSDIFEVWNVEITSSMATCLLVGIYADTGGFRYPPTDRRTFLTAANLIERAPNIGGTLFAIENDNAPEVIAFESLMLQRIEVKGRVALAGVTHDDLSAHGIGIEHTASVRIANRLTSVKDWMIGASLVEREPGKVSVSFRSRDANVYDVSQVADRIGGGGHKAAAGALFRGTIAEAKGAVLAAVAEFYPELLE